MAETKRLSALGRGEVGMIREVEAQGDELLRLYNLGFVPGETVCCLLISPLGDPAAYGIKNTLIALRREISFKILIE